MTAAQAERAAYWQGVQRLDEERRETAQRFAEGVGFALFANQPHSVEEWGRGYRLSGPGSFALTFWPEGDRLAVAGAYPRTRYSYSYSGKTARMALSRPLESVVKEIRRRVLPEYLAELDKRLGQIADDRAAESRETTLTRELAGLLGDPQPRSHGYDDAPTIHHHHRNRDGHAIYAAFTVQAGAERVDVRNLTIPADLAVAIARTIAEYEEAR